MCFCSLLIHDLLYIYIYMIAVRLLSMFPFLDSQSKHSTQLDQSYRERLVDFYRLFNPSKVPQVGTILTKYKGKELLVRRFCKYIQYQVLNVYTCI